MAIAIHSTPRALDAPRKESTGGWRDLAACRGMSPGVFHDRRQEHEALRVCARCPVAEPCLWQAMVHEQATGIRAGVWGQTTPAQRDAIWELLRGRGLRARDLLDAEAAWWARKLRGRGVA
ncbi:WhiB family transcriptional regulator [Aciditerrimonas ferrireducens]|uniref:WhiB family transcriptional regulator n=1 Tax=Aciditerrimonas ferrireducens TaxID=667306 RepID=A0ABV6BZT5_9ACTN